MAQASVVRPSIVRKLLCLGNRCMDPDQILWEATYPPYVQTIFCQNFQFSNFQIFYDFVFIFVNMGPYGSKKFKALLLQFSSDLNQTL